MSQINLSNWEIVDDVQNSRMVIRSKITGEQIEINESGALSSSSGIDADTVDGEEADSLGTQYFIRGETADYVADTLLDLPPATGSQDTALLLDPNEFFNRAVDVAPSEGGTGIFTDPVSENLTDILPSTTGEGFLDIQFFKDSNFFRSEFGETLIALNDNNELKQFTLERFSDVSANATLQDTYDLTDDAPAGVTATSFFIIDAENNDVLSENRILIGYDNGEIVQYATNTFSPIFEEETLSTGGTPIDILERFMFLSEVLLVVTDNDEIEEYSYDGNLNNSTLNGSVSGGEASPMQALEINGTATLHRVLADGTIYENQYQPGGDFGSPQIVPNPFGNTNPVFQTAISSPSTIELGRRPRRGSPFIIAGTSDTVIEEISTRRGGYQDDDDYATQFAP